MPWPIALANSSHSYIFESKLLKESFTQGFQKYKTFNKDIRKVNRCPLLTLLHFHTSNCISIIDRSCFCTFRAVFVSATCDIERMDRNTEKRNLSIEMTVSETLE